MQSVTDMTLTHTGNFGTSVQRSDSLTRSDDQLLLSHQSTALKRLSHSNHLSVTVLVLLNPLVQSCNYIATRGATEFSRPVQF